MFKNKIKGIAAAVLALSIITSGASLVPSASFGSINANAALNANQKIAAFRQYPYIIDSYGLPEDIYGSTIKYVVKNKKVYLSEMVALDGTITIPKTIRNINVSGVTTNFKISGNVKNVNVSVDNLDVTSFIDTPQNKAEREKKEGYTEAIKGVLQKAPNLESINNETVIIDGHINLGVSEGVKKVIASLNAEDNSAITKAMTRYINNKAVEIITSPITGKIYNNDYDKVKALHNWVANNTNYDFGCWRYRDASDWSIFVNPSHLAVCDGYTRGLTLLLRSLNFEAYYESFGYKENDDTDNHCGTIVKIYDDFYHIDSTWDGQSSKTHHLHFLKDDSVYRKDRGHTKELECAEDEVVAWSGSNKLVIRYPSTIYTDNGYMSNPRINCNTFFGDLNGDKKFDGTDVARLKAYVRKTARYEDFDSNARKFLDFNHDGYIDMNDFNEMQFYLDSLVKFNR